MGAGRLKPPLDHMPPVLPVPRDKGMRHMVGPDWRQLFDVVIVQADKPSFFTDPRKYGLGTDNGAREWGLALAYHPVWLG